MIDDSGAYGYLTTEEQVKLGCSGDLGQWAF
jgi:hypothetical protein